MTQRRDLQAYWKTQLPETELTRRDPSLSLRPDEARTASELPTILDDPAASPTVLDSAPSTGSRPDKGRGIGEYTFLKELARGGMGVVYEARQGGLERQIAIKAVLDRSGQGDAGFLRESRVTAQLEHPNIVPVYDLGRSDGRAFLAMKLVGGFEWRRLIRPQTPEQHERRASMAPDADFEILLKVCDAVAFAHSKGVVHCDLKPENVMVGAFGEVLVMDWGVAVGVEPGAAATPRSAVSGPRGTPCYMPPELAEGRGEAIDQRTDVFLLGAILYEVLMKRPPHRGGSLMAVLIEAARGEPPELSDAIPEELASICRRAMAGEPADRYPDVSGFEADLRSYLRHRESLALSSDANARLARLGARDQEGLRRRERDRLYTELSEVIAAFQQAHALWQHNPEASRGEQRARETLARTAIDNSDLGLAEAQLTALGNAATGELQQGLEDARRAEERGQRRGRLLRLTAASALAATLLTGAVAFVIVSGSLRETQEALGSRNAALKSEKEARAEVEEQRDTIAAQQRQERRQLGRFFPDRARRSWEARDVGETKIYAARSLAYLDSQEARGLWAMAESTGMRFAWSRSRLPEVIKLAWPRRGEELLVAGRFGFQRRAIDSGARTFEPEPQTTFAQAWVQDAESAQLAFLNERGEVEFCDRDRKRKAFSLDAGSSEGTLALSADGRLAALTKAGLRIWQLPKRALLTKAPKPRGYTGSRLAWSPDGQALALTTSSALSLCDTNGSVRARLPARAGAIAWRPDGQRLAFSDRRSLVICDPRGQKQDRIGEQSATIADLAWLGDDRLVSASAEGLALWAVDRRAIIDRQLLDPSRRWSESDREQVTLAPSPDGRSIIAGSEHGILARFDLDSGRTALELRWRVTGPTRCDALLTNGDGGLLGEVSQRLLRFWSSDSGEPRASFLFRDRIRALAFDPRGGSALALDERARLRVLSPDEDTEPELRETGLAPTRNPYGRRIRLCVSDDGRHLAAMVKGELRVWTWPGFRLLGRYRSADPIRDAAFVPGKNLRLSLLVTSKDRERDRRNKLYLWRPSGDLELFDAPGLGTDAVWTRASDQGVLVDSRGAVRAIDAATAPRALRGAITSPAPIACLNSERRSGLVAFGAAQRAHVYRLHTRSRLRLSGHRFNVTQVAVSREGVAACGSPGDLRYWRLQAGAKSLGPQVDLDTEKGERPWALGPSGELLVSSQDERRLRVWNTQGRDAAILDHGSPVELFRFSPDGRQLIAATAAGALVFWDARSGAKLRAITAHDGPVSSLAFDSDGLRLASAGADKRVVVWEAESGRRLASLELDQAVLGLALASKKPLLAFAQDLGGKGRFMASHRIVIYDWASEKELGSRLTALFLPYLDFHPRDDLILFERGNETVGYRWRDRIDAWVLKTSANRHGPRFGAGGRLLACWGGLGFRLFDLETSSQVARFDGGPFREFVLPQQHRPRRALPAYALVRRVRGSAGPDRPSVVALPELSFSLEGLLERAERETGLTIRDLDAVPR